jgi:hypothetical protein
VALCLALAASLILGFVLLPDSGRPPKAPAVIYSVSLRLGAPNVPGAMAVSYEPGTVGGGKGGELGISVGLSVAAHQVVPWAADILLSPATKLTHIPMNVKTSQGSVHVIQTPHVSLVKQPDVTPPVQSGRTERIAYYILSGSVTGPSDGFGALSQGLSAVAAAPQNLLLLQPGAPLPYVYSAIQVNGEQPIARSGNFVTVALPNVVTQPFTTTSSFPYPAARFQAEGEADVGARYSPYLGTETQVATGQWDWRSTGDLGPVSGSGVDQEAQRHDERFSFYSGVAFGVAGNAFVSLIVVLLGGLVVWRPNTRPARRPCDRASWERGMRGGQGEPGLGYWPGWGC